MDAADGKEKGSCKKEKPANRSDCCEIAVSIESNRIGNCERLYLISEYRSWVMIIIFLMFFQIVFWCFSLHFLPPIFSKWYDNMMCDVPFGKRTDVLTQYRKIWSGYEMRSQFANSVPFYISTVLAWNSRFFSRFLRKTLWISLHRQCLHIIGPHIGSSHGWIRIIYSARAKNGISCPRRAWSCDKFFSEYQRTPQGMIMPNFWLIINRVELIQKLCFLLQFLDFTFCPKLVLDRINNFLKDRVIKTEKPAE